MIRYDFFASPRMSSMTRCDEIGGYTDRQVYVDELGEMRESLTTIATLEVADDQILEQSV